MTIASLLFAVGVFAVSFFTRLPPLWLSWLLLALFPLLFWRPRWHAVLALLLGLGWGAVSGWQLLAHQLPNEQHGQLFTITGDVTGLPQRDAIKTRFQLRVDEVQNEAGEPGPHLQRVLLSWYASDVSLELGQRWQLKVKLRRPRGFANPGGFDYQGWLVSQGVSATGYVRSGDGNRLLAEQVSWPDSWRFQLQLKLSAMALPPRAEGLLRALIIGDSSQLSAQDWQRLNRTGTTHLLVISGLHIGLFALFCFLLGSGAGRLLNRWLPHVPAKLTGLCFSLLGGLLYAGLAGFGLPTQRALIMLLVVVVTQLLRTQLHPLTGLSVALALVALLDPLAVHSAGFWLSFGAVAALLWVFSSQRQGKAAGWRSWWRKWWLPQWTVFVGLFGLLLLFFGQLPLLSPLSNAIAIPWVSVGIVPLCLLGVMVLPVSVAMAEWCWRLAGWQLQQLWLLLEQAEAHMSNTMFQVSVAPSWSLCLALLIGAMLVLLPHGLPGRWLGWLPVALLLLAQPQRSALQLTVLDVGQGLAVVVNTASKTLVYDTGARFSERFNAGSGVVVPYLRSRGLHQVDRLIVGHQDNDHAGGVDGLLAAMPVADIWAGEAERLRSLLSSDQPQQCRRGMRWQWDGVEFLVLSPHKVIDTRSGNNRSCVLLIRYQGQQVLLAGDIEAKVETELLEQQQLPRQIDILVAPHHGSRTSSTWPFVQHVEPSHVIYSAGYRHHFGHPHPSVVKRYQTVGAQSWNTATAGAVSAVWADGSWSFEGHRAKRRYFWQDCCENDSPFCDRGD